MLKGEGLFKELLESAPDAIIIVDDRGRIVLANSQAEKIFGWTRSELVGGELEMLLPARHQKSHVGRRMQYFREPSVRPMGSALELSGQRKNGEEFPVEVSLSPLYTEDGQFAISAIRDVTERKRAEERIRASLREKEVLLKEIHHRVKNNLQIISSILNLQADAIEDVKTRQIFDDSRSRIRSIALVHERLYESKNLEQVDFRDYVLGLLEDIFHTFGVDRDRISVELNVPSIVLNIDKVVNCGLIVNELVSNAIKYAFAGRSEGKLSISLGEHGDELQLVIKDDGVGLPAGFAKGSGKSLGLTLVEGLAKELDGRFEIASREGTVMTVSFAK